MNIYINDKKDNIPDDETCYIIAKDGIYLKKKLDLIESITPIDKISFLEDMPTFARIMIPKIPTRLIGNIVGFFKKVYEIHKSEAVALIFYNKDKKRYRILVPDQEVSFSSIDYDSKQTIKDYVLVSSIHSHASMSAFHSGTDISDEEKFDGIHFTIGKINSELFEICASIVVNGMRIVIPPEDYIENLECIENESNESYNIPGVKIYNYYKKPKFGYKIDSDDPTIYNFKEEWLEKVKEKVYQYTFKPRVTYTFKDGKLIKNEIPEDKQIKHDPLMFVENVEDKKIKKFCACDTCIHKHEKLTNETIDYNLIEHYEYNWADYLT